MAQNRTFWDVSTTSATSPQFGHFVSKDAIQQFTQPHQRAFDALLRVRRGANRGS